MTTFEVLFFVPDMDLQLTIYNLQYSKVYYSTHKVLKSLLTVEFYLEGYFTLFMAYLFMVNSLTISVLVQNCWLLLYSECPVSSS